MSRGITYRAWNGEMMSKPFDPRNLIRQKTGLVDGFGVSVWWEGCKFEWMQFTGLKDTNGKDIYEGDILLLHIPHAAVNLQKGRIPFVVVFYVDGFAVYGKQRAKNFLQQVVWSTPHKLNYSKWTNTEVIGNIHENPELLEK